MFLGHTTENGKPEKHQRVAGGGHALVLLWKAIQQLMSSSDHFPKKAAKKKGLWLMASDCLSETPFMKDRKISDYHTWKSYLVWCELF